MLGHSRSEILGVNLIEITEESQRSRTEINVQDLFDGYAPATRSRSATKGAARGPTSVPPASRRWTVKGLMR